MVDPLEFIAPRNSFAMSFRDFVPHLNNVLDQLGMSIHARTQFVKSVVNLAHFTVFPTQRFTVTTYHLYPATETLPTASSPQARSPPPSTSQSHKTRVSSLVYSSSGEGCRTTKWATSQRRERRRPTHTIGARLSGGPRTQRTRRCSEFWRRLCSRLHDLVVRPDSRIFIIPFSLHNPSY